MNSSGFFRVLTLGLAAAVVAFGWYPATAAEPVVPAAVSPDYLIGPGDSLHVFVFQNEELSVTVPVRPDGKISTPLVEDMVAVGKTPSQLARDIEKSLSEYVKSPKVNVVVMGAIAGRELAQAANGEHCIENGHAVPVRESLRMDHLTDHPDLAEDAHRAHHHHVHLG